ncbi:unnamed protein product [Gordionus sp. m RMFG-2023]
MFKNYVFLLAILLSLVSCSMAFPFRGGYGGFPGGYGGFRGGYGGFGGGYGGYGGGYRGYGGHGGFGGHRFG